MSSRSGSAETPARTSRRVLSDTLETSIDLALPGNVPGGRLNTNRRDVFKLAGGLATLAITEGLASRSVRAQDARTLTIAFTAPKNPAAADQVVVTLS